MTCQCQNKRHTQGCSNVQVENQIMCLWCIEGCLVRGEALK